jgi:hypothetical protein
MSQELAKLRSIFVATDKREPMMPLTQSFVIMGQGLAGDRYVEGNCQKSKDLPKTLPALQAISSNSATMDQ